MLVNPNSNQVKLIDFGLARKYNPNETMQVLCGTPEFIGMYIQSLVSGSFFLRKVFVILYVVIISVYLYVFTGAWMAVFVSRMT